MMSDVRPGDVLLFDRRGWFQLLTKVKTWSDVSHAEIVLTSGDVGAARSGGVHIYDLDLNGLAYVLRPRTPFDVVRALAWHEREAEGQGYDYFGLLNFYWARYRGRANRRMFCSEYVTRALRAGGVEPFQAGKDADTVAPATFLYSAALEVMWRRGS